jgi:bifunctional non-homologous end joining protein LigD
VSPSGTKVAVEVEGRQLVLSNLEKVLYPEVGFSKAQVIDYYSRIAPVMLPHLRGRPATFKRYPDGAEGKFFFEKNAPKHKPDWVRTVELASPGSTKNRETIDYVVIDDLPTLVWAANLASLELHVPMWRVGPRGAPKGADTLVFDLDPGPPATIVECCAVAQILREALAEDGLSGYPKTSGSKGLQLYVPVKPVDPERTWSYAKELAQRLEREHPPLIVFKMEKALRPGKVLVDWSQNSPAKTTVAPYSLRARPRATASTPVTWDEVEACTRPEDLSFTADEVLERVAAHGDLLAPLLEGGPRLPG